MNWDMAMTVRAKLQHDINTWNKFDREVRSKGCELLRKLDDFPESILVTGCQRSGTTVLSRIITNSDGMINYWFGRDDELDAALVLSGHVSLPSKQGRYCFQTTYLNACYHEYFGHENGHKIIWVLRNPFSVIYSMIHNWRRAALGRLFRSCGEHLLDDDERRRFEKIGLWGVSRLRQACLSYIGKTSQLFELKSSLGPDRLMIVSYDELVANKGSLLPEIYRFVDLEFNEKCAEKLHSRSIGKVKRQSKYEASVVERSCLPVYLAAMKLIRSGAQNNYKNI